MKMKPNLEPSAAGISVRELCRALHKFENNQESNKERSGVIMTDSDVPYEQFAKRMLGLGYVPVPIKPKSKMPLGVEKWPRAHESCILFPGRTKEGGLKFKWCEAGTEVSGYYSMTYARHLAENPYYAGWGTGILLGAEPDYLVCLDVDVDNSDLSGLMFQTLLGEWPDLGAGLFRMGRAPRWSVVFRTDVRHEKIKRDLGVRGAIELLGSGQQAVVAGTHPDTGASYKLSAEVPAVEDLPLVPRPRIKLLLDDLAAVVPETTCRTYSILNDGFVVKSATDDVRGHNDADVDADAAEIFQVMTEEVVGPAAMQTPLSDNPKYTWTPEQIAFMFSQVPAELWQTWENRVRYGQALWYISADPHAQNLLYGLFVAYTDYRVAGLTGQAERWHDFAKYAMRNPDKKVTMYHVIKDAGMLNCGGRRRWGALPLTEDFKEWAADNLVHTRKGGMASGAVRDIFQSACYVDGLSAVSVGKVLGGLGFRFVKAGGNVKLWKVKVKNE